MEKEVVKITKITAKGHKFIVNININNDNYIFSENQLVENRIIKGSLFTSDEWNKIMKDHSTGVLYDKILNFIDYKLRSENEVVKKLKLLNATDGQIVSIINKLKDINYINDHRYTQMYIYDSINNYKGHEYIKYHLAQKGIDSNIILEELSNCSNDSFINKGLELANKYLDSIKHHSAYKQKGLVINKLTRCGYTSDIISSIVSKLTFSNNSFNEYD